MQESVQRGRRLLRLREYEWVEDLVVEAIRVGVEVIGQEYIVSRMGWDQKKADDTKVEAEPAPEVATEAAAQ